MLLDMYGIATLSFDTQTVAYGNVIGSTNVGASSDPGMEWLGENVWSWNERGFLRLEIGRESAACMSDPLLLATA
jgi:hypothetical protein